MRNWLMGSILLSTMLFSPVAQAQSANWDLSLANPDQLSQGISGETLTYIGTINNQTGTDLFLNADALNFTANVPNTAYMVKFSDDYLNLLGDVPTTGFTGSLFTVTWLSPVLAGTFGAGTVEMFVDPPASPASLAATFSVSVSAASVPEPGSVALLLGMSLTGAAFLRRRKHARIAA